MKSLCLSKFYNCLKKCSKITENQSPNETPKEYVLAIHLNGGYPQFKESVGLKKSCLVLRADYVLRTNDSCQETLSAINEIEECPEERPEMCIKIYKPVYGVSSQGIERYGNSCMACVDKNVVSWFPASFD